MKITKYDTSTEEIIETKEFVDGHKVYYRLTESEILEKYEELLMAVQDKHPTETRHETALRYIRQAEQKDTDVVGKIHRIYNGYGGTLGFTKTELLDAITK